MSRSILLIICDFLLVSLLAFSTVDLNKVAEEGSVPQAQSVASTNSAASGSDLAAVMRQALDEEQKRRDLLMGELEKTRATASQRQVELQKYQQELQSRTQSFEQTLQEREQEAARLQQEQASLQQQYLATRTNLQALSQQLQSSSTDVALSREKLAALEAELKRRADEAAAFQNQLSQLSKSNQMVLSERQRLAAQLQVAEVEKRHAAEQVVKMQEQVELERAEKAKLAEGVKTLAAKSGELTQEIRENRPLAPNTIFHEFLTNRVRAGISASRPGLFSGESVKNKQTGTVLVSDGTNTYALGHVQDTPLTLWTPGMEWEKLAGVLARNDVTVPIRSLSFLLQDPRIVLIPVSAAEARQLGGKVYQTSNSPFKFQDAVLVGAEEAYYGECRFEIDPTLPGYVKLDRSVLKGMFGKFNPSRGDLVFSKNGDLLGIMANSTYCMVLREFDVAATFQFGPDSLNQGTGRRLSELHSIILQMPFKLQ